MTAADIIRALGGATFLATKIEAKRSAISNWPRDGIPGKYWPPLARLAAAAPETAGITLEVLEKHATDSAKAEAA